MHPHRRKRLFNIILVLLFSTSGIGLILYSLNTNLDYFFTPSELKNKEIMYVTNKIIEFYEKN